MIRSCECLRPRFAALWWSQLLRLSAASAILCAVFLVASAHPAPAGVNVWTSLGLPVGGVGALAIDPITPRTLYAGYGPAYAHPGVYKSTDAGATWGAASAGLPNISGGILLVIDPITPETLYAGTGDGVFKSTDAGATWNAANAGLPNSSIILALAITPQTLYAGISVMQRSGTVFKSTDAGATWNAADAGLPNTWGVAALAVDPITPQTLYAAPAQDGVFKSTDGGSTWNALNTGLNAGPFFISISALAIDPVHPRRVYALGFSDKVFAIEQISACVGDCGGAHTVAVSDLITMVNIALGTAQPAACSNGGLPLGGEVTVAVIIQAVNNALHGCSG